MNYNLLQVLQYLAAELDRHLKDSARPSGYAGLADAPQLSNDPEYSDPNARNRVNVALLNALPDRHEGSRECQIMVFSAFKNYETALARLSRAQDFFRENPVLTAENARAPFPAHALRQIRAVAEPLTLADLRDVWAVRGGRAFPAVFYRVSMEGVVA